MQPLHIVKILSEIGAGKLGTAQGVEQLWAKFKEDYPEQRCSDFIAPRGVISDDNAKYIDLLTAFFQQQVVPPLTELFKKPDFPIILSGDHSNAISTLSALCNAYPNQRVGVLWIDAHSDLHTPYTTPSGNLHGMSLAAVTRQDNREFAVRSPSVETVEYWHTLKHLAPLSKGVNPEDIFFLGLRSYEEQELKLIEQFNIPHISTNNVRKLGFPAVFESIKHHFNDVDLLYVSFDVDALDAMLIPTTGTPEKEGFTYEEIKMILDYVLHLPQLSVFEITEFNPTLSEDNRYLQEIYQLLDYALQQIQKRSKK